MAAAPAFWDVLSARLGQVDAPGAGMPRHEPAVSPFRATFDPGLRFLLLGGGLVGSVPARSASGRPTTPGDGLVDASPACGGSRQRPRLNPRQRQALAFLRACGARLDEAFTEGQLKRAFRRLALRLHPDRHPAAPASERMRLASEFATVSDAYECLRSVPRWSPQG